MKRSVRGSLCVLSLAAAISACGTESQVDPTPEKLDGTPSHEFEPDDIDRAEGASDAVKEYCSGAVSEAQRIGCESHVDESTSPDRGSPGRYWTGDVAGERRGDRALH